jgi:1,4-alpha-glucan branching enzyme
MESLGRAGRPAGAAADGSGIWEGFIPGVQHGHAYKYRIVSHADGRELIKADPFAATAKPLRSTATGSRVWDLAYTWGDAQWMQTRARANALDAPMSIYEVGFTHVELMPSPSIRSTAPGATRPPAISRRRRATARRRTSCTSSTSASARHRRDPRLGALAFSRRRARARALRRHAPVRARRPAQGFHPDWNSAIFNYGRNEVRNFLISARCSGSSAITSTACASTPSPRCSTSTTGARPGEWIPNRYGGARTSRRSSSCALNEAVYRDAPRHPDDRRGIDRLADGLAPDLLGGLGFG